MTRIVTITGASSDTGRALGAALVARGDEVVLAARTGADLPRVAGELSAQGPGKAFGAILDVRNASEVTDLVNNVYDSYVRWATEHMPATRLPDGLIPSTHNREALVPAMRITDSP